MGGFIYRLPELHLTNHLPLMARACVRCRYTLMHEGGTSLTWGFYTHKVKPDRTVSYWKAPAGPLLMPGSVVRPTMIRSDSMRSAGTVHDDPADDAMPVTIVP
jgi:hypothetical protein